MRDCIIAVAVAAAHLSPTHGVGAQSGMAGGTAATAAMASIEAMGSMSSMAAMGSLKSLKSLESLTSLKGLAGLRGLEALKGIGAGTEALRAMERHYSEDPADSLYRVAQRLLDRGDFPQAARTFASIYGKYPNSQYTPDAYYWQAFALYKQGDEGSLKTASRLLDTQRAKYPKASTRADASTLATRISGALARGGDADAAEKITRQAGKLDTRTSSSSSSSTSSSTSTSSSSSSRCARDDDDDERVAALNTLLQMNADQALPILKRVLARRDQCSVVLRRKAVFLVSQKHTAETEDILLDALKNDPDAEVREQSVFWLSQVPTEKALNALMDILRTSKDREIQKKALFAISQQGRNARSGEVLRDFATRSDVPTELRSEAIFWLGQKRSTENAQFLKDLYPKLSDDELKKKVVFSLSQMKGMGNDEWLMDLATNSKESVEARKDALFWAGQNGGNMEKLVGLYDRMSDHEMKEQLIFVYSQRGRDKTAIDKLFDIAKNEKDRELRKKAIFWISQSRDPRAAAFLEDLISRP